MSIWGYILLAVFLTLAAVVVMWPIFTFQRENEAVLGQAFGLMPQADQLRAEREAVLSAIRELDFDFHTGKLEPGDYHQQREALLTRGVELLKQIDALALSGPSAGAPPRK